MKTFTFGKEIKVLVESPNVSFGSLNLNGLKKDFFRYITRKNDNLGPCGRPVTSRMGDEIVRSRLIPVPSAPTM